MSKKEFAIKIINFQNINAVCKIENTDYEFELPIQQLPDNIDAGSSFVLNISSVDESQKNYAKEALSAMLN